MTLAINVRHRLGNFHLDADVKSEGGVTALFGRSGSGKTSLVKIVAGLIRPDHGKLVFDDETLVDTDKRLFVRMHRRRFGYVFQEGRLFPHLSVRQNLNYGSWFAGRKPSTAEYKRTVEMLGIEALVDRRPDGLSGGEKQRVAIGRALLSAPKLLLMDEPLAALDDERKTEILPYLKRLRDETAMPIIYVSHSVAEVAQLADTVVMMREGRVEAVGSPSEILSLPGADRREAGAVLSGVVQHFDDVYGLATIALSAATLTVPSPNATVGQRVRIHIPERDVLIATQRPEGLSALNILEGSVVSVEHENQGTARIKIRTGEDTILARITTLSVDRLDLVAGKPVFAVLKSVSMER